MFSVIALWVIVKNFELIFENSFNENTCLTVILGDLNSLSLFSKMDNIPINMDSLESL